MEKVMSNTHRERDYKKNRSQSIVSQDNILDLLKELHSPIHYPGFCFQASSYNKVELNT